MPTQGQRAAAFLIALTTSGTALASPSAKLVYVRGPGAETCPSEEVLRKAVKDRIGYDPFFGSAQKTVVVQITHMDTAYGGRVQIVADGGELRGERQLPKLRDCSEMVASLGLVVSLALDDLDAEPEAQSEPPGNDSERLPAPTSPPVPEPLAEAPVPAVRSKAERSFEGRAGIGPAVTVGTAPSPALAAEADVSFGWGRLGTRIDGRADVPAGEDVAPTGHVITSSLVGVASGCFRRASAFGCVGAGGGVLFARGEGLRQPSADSAPLLVAVGRLGLDLDVGGRAYIEPSLEVGANLLRHFVDIDGRRVYRMSAVWGGAGFHFGVRFF